MRKLTKSSTCGAVTAGLIAAATTATATAAPPKATGLFPAGGGRGQTVEASAFGSFERWPVNVWVSEPGVEFELGEKKGQLSVRVASDATPGLRWVRLYNDEGATPMLPFEVSVLAATAEAEPNADLAEAQQLNPLPIIIDGRLSERHDVDGFAVKLTAGQTLVASLKGNRLGSPMDAVLQLVSLEGFVLQQSDDEIGLDPQLVFKAPSDGTYIVRCFAFPAEPTSRIDLASGDDFLYRLTLTTEGFLDHSLPLAIAASESGNDIRAFGWNIPENAGPLLIAPAASPEQIRVSHPLFSQFAELPLVDVTNVVESQHTDSDSPQQLQLPGIVSGRVGQHGEADSYEFAGKQGNSYQVRVVARELASALDPVLTILDDTGNIVSEQDDSDPNQRDVDISFTVPRNGLYQAIVSDLQGRGGLRYYYRLEITQPKPDFGLSLSAAQVTLASEDSATLRVTLERKHGFDRPIEITAVGLPPGVEAPPVTIDPEPIDEKNRKKRGRRESSTQEVTLTLKRVGSTEGSSVSFTVVGRAVDETGKVERQAMAATPIAGVRSNQIWLTVSPEAN